jgi:hypothetical protein
VFVEPNVAEGSATRGGRLQAQFANAGAPILVSSSGMLATQRRAWVAKCVGDERLVGISQASRIKSS